MQAELKKDLEDLSSKISSIKNLEELQEARLEVRNLLSKIEYNLNMAKMLEHKHRG